MGVTTKPAQARPSTRIIDLGELRNRDEFPSYVAIFSPLESELNLLSPTAMRWSDRIHLNRLDDCRLFWLEQKKKTALQAV